MDNPDSDLEKLPNLAKRLLAEPLVQFIIVAGLLFAVQAVLVGDAREEIFVDAATQEFLMERERDLTLTEPTPEDLERLIDSFVEDEILVREATKQGFTDSSRVRALLIQNMRFFITGDIPEPTEEILRAYFEENQQSFASPPSLDLEHLLYQDPDTVPEGLAARLNAGEDPRAFGDPDFNYGRVLRFMDTRRLAGAFGRDGAQQVLSLAPNDGSWHGPILSPQGSSHFVRVIARNAPSVPEFEAAYDWIATQWLADQARQAVEDELSVMRENYRITVEPLDSTQ